MGRSPPRRLTDVADFYVHLPIEDLRDLLNIKSQLGEEFSDAQAAADLGLDLDRLTHTNRAIRLGKLHSQRYYAQRWGWTKTRVQNAFAGDERRGTEAWIEKAAQKTIGRYSEPPATGPATTGDHSATTGDQKPTPNGSQRQIRDHSATTGDHSATKEEQYLQGLQKSGEGERAREPSPSASAPRPLPSGGSYGHPAVVAYAEAVGPPGEPWAMPPVSADQIARRFGSDPDADAVRTLAEFVAAYAASGWKARNVPTVLQAFDEHLARQAAPARTAANGRARGSAADARDRRQADLDDPAAAHERNLAAARAALGAGPVRVGD